MTEKQASSEIAQSRERFEKTAVKQYPDLSFRRETSIECDIYWNPMTQQLWEVWQAAERDTRERIAQIVERLWEEPGTSILSEECELVAERIRGKE